MEQKEIFEYVDTNNLDHKIEIAPEDLKVIKLDSSIHDVKFKTKPTTYLKDAFKRFLKNKSSVVGAIILGILVLGAIVLPIVLPGNIESTQLDELYLEPKLFPAGTGFWDGTKKYENFTVAYDTVNETPAGFKKNAVIEGSVSTQETKINTTNNYAFGGYVNFNNTAGEGEATSLYSYPTTFDFGNDVVTMNIELLDKASDSTAYELGEYQIVLTYGANNENSVVLKDYSKNYGNISVNVTETLKKNNVTETSLERVSFRFNLRRSTEKRTQLLIKSVTFDVSGENSEELESALNYVGFDDANAMVRLDRQVNGVANTNYWTCNGTKGVYDSTLVLCNFTYDTYEAAFGLTSKVISQNDMVNYINNGYCTYDFTIGPESFVLLDEANCPITSVDSQYFDERLMIYTMNVTGYNYRFLGYSSYPIYILGTDNQGQDLLKQIFAGLRTSLLLGIGTALVCITFGVIWGSISGYFGGNVDIVMERITDILSGVPWIVVMTLCILHLGNNFGTFILALCLTGWIGTSSVTRSQFYRFKGREYVLAARTLGANDFRLIFRHILPNSIGTLVTNSVLMIPSVIFSEATISYLNLGLQGLPSLGVLLSDNQQFINSYSYLIIWPAVIISLIMISFNLFGNGLRDAFNPSLKGAE